MAEVKRSLGRSTIASLAAKWLRKDTQWERSSAGLSRAMKGKKSADTKRDERASTKRGFSGQKPQLSGSYWRKKGSYKSN